MGALTTGANVGPSYKQSDAFDGQTPTRLERSGAVVIQKLYGDNREATFRGLRFSGATSPATPVATTAALATTYTGLILLNPAGSGVNVSLNAVSLAPVVAQAAAMGWGLMTGFAANAAVSAVTTSITANVSSNFVGGASATKAILGTAATLPATPTVRELLGALGTGAITTQMLAGGRYEIESGIELAPGGFVCLYTSVASAALSLHAGFDWTEIPLGS